VTSVVSFNTSKTAHHLQIILTFLLPVLLVSACKKSSSTDENSTPEKIARSQDNGKLEHSHCALKKFY